MPNLALDMPDDYPWLPGSSRFPIADLGELAARLASPVTYDRRGEVLWMDVCGRGFSPYYTRISGTGSEIYLDCNYSHHGGYVIVLKGGSNGSRYAAIYKRIGLFGVTSVGLEVAVSLITVNNYFQLHMEKQERNVYKCSDIGLWADEQKVKYKDTSEVWQDIITGVVLDDPNGVIQHVKYVVDFENNEYKRLLFNEQSYDLAGIPIYTKVVSHTEQFSIRLEENSRVGYNDVAQVAHVIVTGNEP